MCFIATQLLIPSTPVILLVSCFVPASLRIRDFLFVCLLHHHHRFLYCKHCECVCLCLTLMYFYTVCFNSMEGTILKLPEIVRLKKKYKVRSLLFYKLTCLLNTMFLPISERQPHTLSYR